MKVQCEKCSSEYNLDDRKLSASGVTVKCTNCGHMFKVRRRQQTSEQGSPAAQKTPQSEGQLRTWLVRLGDGEIRACYELSTLQEWIAAGDADESCQISRNGNKWKSLGDIPELASFFRIADQAKRKDEVQAHPNTVPREATVQRVLPAPKKTVMGAGPIQLPGALGQAVPPVKEDVTVRVPTVNEDDVMTVSTPAPNFKASKPVVSAPSILGVEDDDEARTSVFESKPVGEAASTEVLDPSEAADMREEVRKEANWAAAGAIKPAAGSLGPSFGSLRADREDSDAVEPVPPSAKKGGIAKWVAAGSIAVIAGAVAVIGGVFGGGDADPEATQSSKPAQQPESAVGPASQPDKLDAAAGEPTELPTDTVLASALSALYSDTAGPIEASLKQLQSRSDDDDVAGAVAQIRAHLALAQISVDSAAGSRRAARRGLRRRVAKQAAKAGQLAKEARKRAPENADVIAVSAEHLRMISKPSRQIFRLLNKVDAVDGGHREAALSRAMMVLGTKQTPKARKMFEALVDDSISDVRPRYRLAALDVAAEQWGAARAHVDIVLGIAPDHAGAKALSATITANRVVADATPPPTKNPPRTKTSRSATTSGPASYGQLLKKADAVAESGKCGVAIPLYEQALDQNPGGVGSLVGLGYCHLDRRNYASAQSKFRAALGVSPRSQMAMYGIAEAYQQQGNKDKAVAAFKKFVEVHPSVSRASSARRQIQRLGGDTATKPAEPVAKPVEPIAKPVEPVADPVLVPEKKPADVTGSVPDFEPEPEADKPKATPAEPAPDKSAPEVPSKPTQPKAEEPAAGSGSTDTL